MGKVVVGRGVVEFEGVAFDGIGFVDEFGGHIEAKYTIGMVQYLSVCSFIWDGYWWRLQ